jgi:hypothetical protein
VLDGDPVSAAVQVGQRLVVGDQTAGQLVRRALPAGFVKGVYYQIARLLMSLGPAHPLRERAVVGGAAFERDSLILDPAG